MLKITTRTFLINMCQHAGHEKDSPHTVDKKVKPMGGRAYRGTSPPLGRCCLCIMAMRSLT